MVFRRTHDNLFALRAKVGRESEAPSKDERPHIVLSHTKRILTELFYLNMSDNGHASLTGSEIRDGQSSKNPMRSEDQVLDGRMPSWCTESEKAIPIPALAIARQAWPQ
jgi:hypothetical protein